jgi:hypothetical protein
MAVVGERVEAEVEAVVDLQLRLARLVGNKRQPLRLHVLFGKKCSCALAVRAFGGQHDQARALDAAEYLPP